MARCRSGFFPNESPLGMRCVLPEGHRGWHRSGQTIWPDHLDLPWNPEIQSRAAKQRQEVLPAADERLAETEPEPSSPEPESANPPERIPELVIATPRRRIWFSAIEDWHCEEREGALKANPKHLGLLPEGLLWWDDEWEINRGWEPEAGMLTDREMIASLQSWNRWGRDAYNERPR